MSNKDTDDVLDFINSLPDSSANVQKTQSKTGGSNDDFQEFLDELTAHEKNAKPVGGSRGKFEPKKRTDATADSKSPTKGSTESRNKHVLPAEFRRPDSTPGVEHEPKTTDGAYSQTPSMCEENTASADNTLRDVRNGEHGSTQDEVAVDPLSSISSWWNTEGSSKVSSLWGSITSNAHQLSETTYQIASSTSQSLSHQRQKLIMETGGVAESDQILHISSKLNSILTTMSQQIKDGLIDKEDELMNILLVHDFHNVTFLDSLCAAKFDKVMGQVEGGIKTTVNNFNHKQSNDAVSKYYDLSMFSGKSIDGEKLCFANLESSIKHYSKITDSEQPQTTNEESVGHEINKSNVFIAIQSITPGNNDHSTGGPTFANNADSFSFTMILKDITNNITIVSKSQPFPLKWARWITGNNEDIVAEFGSNEGEESVDPSEWVRGWIQDGLGLAFAVLAQEYITRRMGI